MSQRTIDHCYNAMFFSILCHKHCIFLRCCLDGLKIVKLLTSNFVIFL